MENRDNILVNELNLGYERDETYAILAEETRLYVHSDSEDEGENTGDYTSANGARRNFRPTTTSGWFDLIFVAFLLFSIYYEFRSNITFTESVKVATHTRNTGG